MSKKGSSPDPTFKKPPPPPAPPPKRKAGCFGPIRDDKIFFHDGNCSEPHRIKKYILSTHSIEQLRNFKERGATCIMTPSRHLGICTFKIDELIELKNQEDIND